MHDLLDRLDKFDPRHKDRRAMAELNFSEDSHAASDHLAHDHRIQDAARRLLHKPRLWAELYGQDWANWLYERYSIVHLVD